MAPVLLAFKSGLTRVLLPSVFLLVAGLAGRATTVTVIHASPMESLSASNEVTGVTEAQVGASYTLVSCAQGQATLSDAQGNHFRLAASATDYVPPAVASAPPKIVVPATAPAPPPMSASSAATTSSPAAEHPKPLPGSTPANSRTTGNVSVAAMNAALGRPFFTDQTLWQETALLVAQRLGLGLEGRTQWEASYRRYFSGQPDDPKAAILGTGAYCVAIYADASDHPTSILIAFANDGDFHGIGQVATDLEGLNHALYLQRGDMGNMRREYDTKFSAMMATFESTRKAEQDVLTDRLTNLLGTPQQTVFGTEEETREKTLRWDWNGASFLLTCQPEKYDLLRIVPTELADNNGRTPRIARDDIGHKLSGAVEHRDNGDTVITQIPMADQGNKGYCVPATWERVLRYTGVPGDMYTLSRIGDAHFGGGEDGLKVADQLNKTLDDYGRHAEVLNPSHLDYIAIRHYIDDGVPIFWGVNPKGYDGAEQRYSLCDRNKDFDTWKKLLDQARATPETGPLPTDGGHQVLIIGYNPDTKEIAWTDPWGRDTRERWMTQEEAQRCSLNQFYIISW